MSDVISRQAAIDAVYKCADIFAGDIPVMVVKADAYEALAQLPSAQPERIRGRWIEKPHVMELHIARCVITNYIQTIQISARTAEQR